ncbi:MHS family MFS transporter [Sphingomonas ginsenosidivorax]|uniref:MHS family MFS transporter n=1 Tax=Sphingomonas ginsenosidivorax TaxID=862135 RepID=A0A5C6UAJ6_9SPHN|nr:MFS transporter [Sphingomonas ginsenosidivorax]TXC69590.1 MHS family MFS transporter [Sphingomonas ginsenosidivorax]
MSASTVTQSFEDDARDIHDHGKAISPGEIAIGVVIGRTSEFFDFFVYAIASVLVFPTLIFPFVDRLQGTIYSFAVFALAFIARPIGSLIFIGVDRTYGRSVKLTIALFLLGTSTVAMGFLPSYESVGYWAIALLALLRIGQGIALGGAWDGLASLLSLNAPEKYRGWYAMLPQLGAPFGLLVASGLFAFFVVSLPTVDFFAWGWRYPFFVAFAINVVALFARLRLVVTPEFESMYEKQELQPEAVIETVRAEWRTIWLGSFAPLASFALFHMVTVFPLSWILLFTREAPGRFLVIEMIGAVIGLGATLVSGLLADRFGRRTLLGTIAVLIAVFAIAAPMLLSGGDMGERLFMGIGFVLFGLSFGQSSGAVASSLAPRHRYTGSALTTDLAWLFGAGFAPLAALLLSARFGLAASGAYLFSGAVFTLIALGLNKELAKRNIER